MIYEDKNGDQYAVEPVTSKNAQLRDDLLGFEGKGYIVCGYGGIPLVEAQIRFSEAKAEQDLEKFAEKYGWHKVEDLTTEQKMRQELELNDFLQREIEQLQPELY